MLVQQKIHEKFYQNPTDYYKLILPANKIDLNVNRIKRNLKFIFLPSAWLAKIYLVRSAEATKSMTKWLQHKFFIPDNWCIWTSADFTDELAHVIKWFSNFQLKVR